MPAATDIQQLLINEANRIGPDIYRKTLNSSPWLKLVKKDTWPDEMGDTISVLTYERSLPANALNWSTVSVNNVPSRDGTFSNNTTAGSPAGTPSSTTPPSSSIPSAQTVSFAQTLRSYNLKHTAIESPRISVNDLRFSLKRKEQLSNIFQILQDNTSYAWQDRYRDEYARVAQNKVTAAAFGSTLVQVSSDGSVFNAGAHSAGTPAAVTASAGLPSSILTQGILDRTYMKLIRDGAGNNPLDRENSRPVFGAILSSESSRNIIVANSNVREDYRFSDSKNELLAPLGISRSYAGFFHMVDDWLPRHDALVVTTALSSNTLAFTVYGGGAGSAVSVGDVLTDRAGKTAVVTVAGAYTAATGAQASTTISVIDSGFAAANTDIIWVRRKPYVAVATTQGSKFDVSSAYELAKYEDTIVFHQDVFVNLVPKPITAAGANVTFDAVSYMGDFKWKNILNETTNPDGTLGYFRAILSAGSKPVRPEWGTVIRHLRASTPLLLTGVTNGGANIQPVITATSVTSGGVASA